jgi:hypothetical protein
VPDTFRPHTFATMSPTSAAAAALARAQTALSARLPGVETASCQLRDAPGRGGDRSGLRPGDIGPAMVAAGYPVADRATDRDAPQKFDRTCIAGPAWRGPRRPLSDDARRVTAARVNLATRQAEIIGTPEGGFDATRPSTWSARATRCTRRTPAAQPSPKPHRYAPDETAPYRRSFLIAAAPDASGLRRRNGGASVACLSSLASPDRGTDTAARGAIRF